MLDLALMAAIGAEDTYRALSHLSLDTQKKAALPLVEKLTPFGHENHAYACWVLSIIHPDLIQKEHWLEKAAALGNLTAQSRRAINAVMSNSPFERPLDLLVRHVKFMLAYFQETQQPEISPTDYLKQCGYSKYATPLFEKTFAESTITAEDLKTLHDPHMKVSAYITPKTKAEHDFIEAVVQGNLNAVSRYLKAGGNPLLYKADLSALHFAIQHNHIAVLKILIETYQQYGLSIVSALEYAVLQNQTECIRVLLDAGVDPRTVYKAKHPMLDEHLNQRTETLSLHVVTLTKDTDGTLVFESYDNTRVAYDITSNKCSNRPPVGNEGFVLSALPCKHPLTEVLTVNKAYEAQFNYKIKLVNGYADEDEVELTFTPLVFGTQNPRFEKMHNGFLIYWISNLTERLEQHSLNFSILSFNETPNISLNVSFPRHCCPVILNHLFEMHESHLCALSSDKPLSELTLLRGLSDAAVARVNAMTPSYFPNAAIPMLHDVTYVRVLRPIIDAHKKKYRAYAELRSLAWILSSGYFASANNLAKEALILIAAYARDAAVLNWAEANIIVTPCFERPIKPAYTPRLFLPATTPPASPLSPPNELTPSH